MSAEFDLSHAMDKLDISDTVEEDTTNEQNSTEEANSPKEGPNSDLKSALLALPPELHLHLKPFLGYRELCLLRATCRTLRVNIPAPTEDELCETESRSGWFAERKLWACYECFRVLPAKCFDDKSRAKRKNRGASRCKLRNCVECAMDTSRKKPGRLVIKPGSKIEIDEKQFTLCIVCKSIKRYESRFGSGPPHKLMCKECNQPTFDRQIFKEKVYSASRWNAIALVKRNRGEKVLNYSRMSAELGLWTIYENPDVYIHEESDEEFADDMFEVEQRMGLNPWKYVQKGH